MLDPKPLLELKLEKESHFLNALEAMLLLVDVASVDCFNTGLKLRAVHREQIVFISLHFHAKDFQDYSCDEVLSMGIPIDDMVKVIRRADKDDTITIKVCRENFDTITISFESPSQENNTTTYDLSVVDDSSHRFRIPDWQHLKLKYQALVQMPSAEFMHVCKCLSNIDRDGHMSVTEKDLKFFASGKSGRVNIKYMQPEKATAPIVTYSVAAPVSLTLDMKYMYSIAKASTLFDQVEICLFTTQLLMVQCKIRQLGYIRFFLAQDAIIRETEEAEIKKRKRSKRDYRDERRAEEDKGSAESNGSGEEDKGSAEINGSAEGSSATLFELKLGKESLFLNALEAMLHLVDVASVDCSSMGLKLRAVDSKHIVFIALFFPTKDFDYYSCNKVHSMGIPINDMAKAIGGAHKDDTINIKISSENFDTITISLESPQENNTTTYDLPVVDDSSHRFRIPDWQHLKLQYQAFVQMPSVEFMRVWKCLSNIGGDGRISVTEKGLKFFASGKSGCMNIKYMQPGKATAPVVTYSGAPVSLTLDMKYMYSIAKAFTLFDHVEICLSTTQLLMVQCNIGQMGYIRFFVTPKGIIRETEEAEKDKGNGEGKKESKDQETED